MAIICDLRILTAVLGDSVNTHVLSGGEKGVKYLHIPLSDKESYVVRNETKGFQVFSIHAFTWDREENKYVSAGALPDLIKEALMRNGRIKIMSSTGVGYVNIAVKT